MGDHPPTSFSSRRDVERWLCEQQPQISGVVAMRTAFRVFPLCFPDARILENRGQSYTLSLNLVLATGLLSCVDHSQQGNVLEAARIATSAANDAVSAAPLEKDDDTSLDEGAAPDAIIEAGRALSGSIRSCGRSATRCIFQAARSSITLREAIFHAAAEDAAKIHNGANAFSIAQSAIWPTSRPPSWSKHWEWSRAILKEDPLDWDNWSDWYEHRLRGGPYDPEYEAARVLELASDKLIRNPKRSTAKLNEAIERIRQERHARVVKAVEEFPATELTANWRDTGAPPPANDNQPPDEFADEVLHPLEELKRPPKNAQEARRWAKAARWVKMRLGICLGWTAKKLDLFFTKAFEEAGRQLGGWASRLTALGVAGILLDDAVALAEIVDAAQALLATFGISI